MDYFEESLRLHRELRGKTETGSRMRIENIDDLSIAYTPGVARPCEVIAANVGEAWDLTWKGRTVAVVSDGSAVLGLGDIGPHAALPVMEGKAVLFKQFGGLDAVPVVLDAREPDDIVRIVTAIAPTYGGINLEDISAPRAFEIEDRLQDIGIPVLHDDQHGTAIVLYAGLLNALKVTGKKLEDLKVVVNGAGAAGRAISRLLTAEGAKDAFTPVGDVLICDSRGIIYEGRSGLNPIKAGMARETNKSNEQGDLFKAIQGADVFIGVSKGNLLQADHIRTMNKDSIVLAMSNPIPEIDPDEAKAGGAAVVGTGRSDYPNQVNNVLAFPGLFRGALDSRATKFTKGMLSSAVTAIAGCVAEPRATKILPTPFDLRVPNAVAKAVAAAAREDGVCHG